MFWCALPRPRRNRAVFRTEFSALLDEVRAIPDAERRQAWQGVAERASELAARYGLAVAPPEAPQPPVAAGGPPEFPGGQAPRRPADRQFGPPGEPWRGAARGVDWLLLGDASRTAALLREYAQSLAEE